MNESEVENKSQEAAAAAGSPTPAEEAQPEPLIASAPTPEQIEELRQRAARADENWDRLLRAKADFDNYKKRASREKQEAIKFANEALLQKLMPVLDNFDMALAAAQTGQGEAAQSLLTGIQMIYQQFKSVLTEAGLEEVDATGQAFDPNLHEAVSQQEAADVPEGHVVQQLRRGYKLRERLLRPATVIVARQPAQA